MLESQIDQQERRETLRNDLTVRQEQEERRRVFAQDQSLPNPSSTFHQHALAKAKEADQALWDAINEHNRQVLRRGLREAVANLRAGRR
jgi:hypothetical protein